MLISSFFVCSFIPHFVLTSDVSDPQFDGVVVVSDALDHIPLALQSCLGSINAYLAVI